MKINKIAFSVGAALFNVAERYMVRSGLLLAALPMMIEKIEDAPEALRDQYVEKDGKFQLQVEGIEDTSNLKSALQKEREQRKEFEKKLGEAAKQLQQFEGFNVDDMKELMKRFQNDEEMKLIKEGKIDEVVNRRTEKYRQSVEVQLEAERNKTKTAEERIKSYEQRVLDEQIRAAASKAGIHAHAVDDALFRARNLFKLNDEGVAIQTGADGKPVLGKDGHTLFSPTEWLESMKESAPHWFPVQASGGGTKGDGGRPTGGKTIKRADFDSKPTDEKRRLMVEEKYTVVD